MDPLTASLFAVFLLLALFFFFWVIRSMLRAACPQCLEDGDPEMVIPLLPGFRWFCPACGGSFKNSEVRIAGEALAKSEEATPDETSEQKDAHEEKEDQEAQDT